MRCIADVKTKRNIKYISKYEHQKVLVFLWQTSYTIHTVVKKQTKKSLSTPRKIHRHIKLAIIPHKDNDYRPHMIRRYGIMSIILLLFVTYGANNYANTGDVLGQQANITPSALLKTINKAREDNNLGDLQINSQLNQAAYAKAQDMFEKQYWSHVSPTGIQPWKWMNDAKYNYSHAGENLAKGFSSSSAVTAAWMASPEHRANVLGSDYRDVGFAIVEGELQGKDTVLVVSMYGDPVMAGIVAGASVKINDAEQSSGVLAVIGEKVKALPAVAIGNIVIVLLAAMLALMAHVYRRKLPRNIRITWYRHHDIYKAIGLTSLSIIIVFMYSGGQI